MAAKGLTGSSQVGEAVSRECWGRKEARRRCEFRLGPLRLCRAWRWPSQDVESAARFMTRSSEKCLAWRHKFKSHQHIDNNEKKMKAWMGFQEEGVDCDGDGCRRSNPESLQGSAVRKGKWCQQKGYRDPRGGRDQESAEVGEGKPTRRLSQ